MFSIYIYIHTHTHTFIHKTELGFPGGSVVKNLPTKAGDLRAVGSIPGSGRSARVGNGSPL